MARSLPKMRSESYVREAIEQLLALMLRSGVSKEELTSFLAAGVNKASSTNKVVTQGLDIHRLGSVLRAWHTEAKFLAADGAPRPLKKSGRNSLRSLVGLYYSPEKQQQVFEKLLKAKLIKRHNKSTWLPTGRHARIPQLSYETLGHLSEGVTRYVETVMKNVTARNERDVLFERSCKVTRLPRRELKLFREYVAQQATAFITAIDDWLESRNAPGGDRGRVTTAGVYTFAYINDRS